MTGTRETRVQRIARMFCCSAAVALHFVSLLDGGTSWAKATALAGVSISL